MTSQENVISTPTNMNQFNYIGAKKYKDKYESKYKDKCADKYELVQLDWSKKANGGDGKQV